MQVHQRPTILLTRPRAASERFAADLDGADVVIAPLMEIIGTGAEVALNGIDALILTSENAVRFVPAATPLSYCVGPRTAEAARAMGLQAEILGPDADGLVQTLADRRPDGRLLHLHGVHTRGDIAARLSEAGIKVDAIAVYDQQEVAPNALFTAALDQAGLIVPLFSPRSAALFARAATRVRNDTRLIALSPAVANALPPAMQAQTHVVPTPNGAEMRKALAGYGVGRNSP